MSSLTAIERELNPFPIYQKMRREQPVSYDPEWGSWNVFCYGDVQRVLSDYSTFSSEFNQGREAGVEQPFAASMISTDPPRHRQLRTLVTQAFTPRAVDSLAPRISTIVQEHLDRVMPTGRMDVIDDLGVPLPVIVIAELLGIPSEDRERFKKWSDWIVQSTSSGDVLDPTFFHNTAVLEMAAYFFDMIEKRRSEPGEDLISGLLEANIDGQHLDTLELLGFCSLLLVAGNETTTNLIGNALMCFTENPEAWQSLRESPDRLPLAIEEVLRYRSPVQSMFRVAKSETSIAGLTIPEGASLVAWIGSANHDETQFASPETFDIDRSPNRHVAFGHGIHYCLGAPLARLEARIALGAMLERFQTVTRVPGEPLERLPSLIVYGLKHLPITFSVA